MTVKSGFWALFFRIAGMLIAFAVSVVLVRLLEPAEMGVYFLAFSIANFLALVSQFGMQNIVVRDVSRAMALNQLGQAKAVVLGGALITLSVGLLVALAASSTLGQAIATKLFDTPMLTAIMPVVGIWGLLLALQAVLAESYRGYRDIVGACVFGGVLSAFLCAIIFLLFYFYEQILSLAYAIGIVISALILNVVAGGATLFRRLGRVTAEWVRPSALFHDVLPLWFNGFASFVFFQIDIWVVGALLVSEDVAVYGAALRLVQVIAIPIFVVEAVLPPIISRFYTRGDTDKLEVILQRATLLQSSMVLIGVVICVLAGEEILTMLFGPYYGSGAFILSVLSAGWFIRALCGSSGFALSMTGNGRILLLITSIAACVAITSEILATHYWGLEGAALAAATVIGITNIAAAIAVKYKLNVWVFPFLASSNRSLVNRASIAEVTKAK